MHFVVETMSARKRTEKKMPPTVKQLPMAKSRSSRTATPKLKDCSSNRQQLSKNNNNSTIQQKPQQLQSCCLSSTVVVFVSCSIASVRLLLFLFPVRLLLSLFPVRFFFKNSSSDTPWASPAKFQLFDYRTKEKCFKCRHRNHIFVWQPVL